MSLKNVFLCWVSLFSGSLAHAASFESSKFDRVMLSSYSDLLRDAASAYGSKRFDKAFELFQRSACAGDKQSQSALGRMYLLR